MIYMEFFDKLTKKASETYKGAAEKTSKLAKEAKLKLKINENKSKINDLYQEIGKKVYQKHTETGDVCIKKDLEEECAKIDILSAEIEKYHKEILDLSDLKKCVKCNEPMDKNAKFCPKCGEEQPAIEETPAMEVEVVYWIVPSWNLEYIRLWIRWLLLRVSLYSRALFTYKGEL